MNCQNSYRSFIELLQNCLGLGVGFDDSLGFDFMSLWRCCLVQVLISNFFYIDMSQNQNQGNVQGDDKKKDKFINDTSDLQHNNIKN